MGALVARALGAETLDVAAHDLANALTDQRLTGAEWGDLAGDCALGLHQATSLLMSPGVSQHGTALTLGLRLQLWERLSESDRTIIEACATEALQLGQAEQIAMAPVAQKVLRGQRAQSMKFEHRSIARAINRASLEIMLAHGQADQYTARIHDSFYAFKANVMPSDRFEHKNAGV